MNNEINTRVAPVRRWPAVLLWAAMGAYPLVNAQTTPSIQPQATGTAAGNRAIPSPEKDEDRQHLERIYKAICAYYRDHQDLPNWLSDLVPQYLADAGDLVSPVETRTGKSVLYGRQDPKLPTSYIYEFNAGTAPEEFNRGRTVPLTCKEWKLMQLKKFGLVTPIIRCHLHNPVLNVAYSGDIYETGLLWENDPQTAALVRSNPQLGPLPSDSSGARVNVKVLDSQTSEPIATASVQGTLGSEFGLLPPAQGTADTNGIVAVALGEWKINFLILTASHPLYESTQLEWNREQDKEGTPPDRLTLKLVRKREASK
jgi:hypothetical protein